MSRPPSSPSRPSSSSPSRPHSLTVGERKRRAGISTGAEKVKKSGEKGRGGEVRGVGEAGEVGEVGDGDAATTSNPNPNPTPTPNPNLNLRDIQIAICKAFSFTHEETAAAVCTPSSPAGISIATVSNRLRLNKECIDSLVTWICSIRRNKELNGKAIAADTLRAEMEKDLGFSWQIIKEAILNGNTQLAMWHIEQAVGKASQPHRLSVTGKVQHEHGMIWTPEPQMLAMQQELEKSDNLLKLLPGGVLEAEVVGADE